MSELIKKGEIDTEGWIFETTQKIVGNMRSIVNELGAKFVQETLEEIINSNTLLSLPYIEALCSGYEDAEQRASGIEPLSIDLTFFLGDEAFTLRKNLKDFILECADDFVNCHTGIIYPDDIHAWNSVRDALRNVADDIDKIVEGATV